MWNKIIRRSIIEKYHLRYPHGLIFEDICFCANLYPVLTGVYFLPEKLYYYYQRTESIMGVARTKTSDKSFDLLNMLKHMFDFYTANGFIKTNSDLYVAFFSKFYNMAHYFSPEEHKDNLITEVPRILDLYGSDDPAVKDRIRKKLMDKIYGPRKTTRKIRFLGIPIYSVTKSWECIVRRILGIRIDEQSGGPTYTCRNNLFYKETPEFSMYRFLGIPLYTKMKGTTKARKIFGITVRRKKAK